MLILKFGLCVYSTKNCSNAHRYAKIRLVISCAGTAFS